MHYIALSLVTQLDTARRHAFSCDCQSAQAVFRASGWLYKHEGVPLQPSTTGKIQSPHSDLPGCAPKQARYVAMHWQNQGSARTPSVPHILLTNCREAITMASCGDCRREGRLAHNSRNFSEVLCAASSGLSSASLDCFPRAVMRTIRAADAMSTSSAEANPRRRSVTAGRWRALGFTRMIRKTRRAKTLGRGGPTDGARIIGPASRWLA
jgi:hypothetical protein